ncbi:transcription factor TFIID-domain-containing protein [Tribonema minus]|uniref:Transcription factor TFIID-domain-containing protein n=1 Tax=Tribonema minus TaxID=303371 RepID=A0A835YVR3_9STRA|nr:transcription factor TFIID-domain-containing protein [Tribonema minus]
MAAEGDNGGGSAAPASTPVPEPPQNPGGVKVLAYNTANCGADWTHHSGIKLVMQNLTMTVNLGTRLDLQAVVQASRNAEYNPKRFAACVMRLRDPKCTALVFASGKMIITGCKSYLGATTGARSFVRILRKVGFRRAGVNDPTPQNIVTTCDMGFPIRLEGLVCDHARYATYEPELFPGLIYRLEHPKVVLIIFVSGKVVMTGGKSLVAMQAAFEIMYPVLYGYRKSSVIVDLASKLPPARRAFGQKPARPGPPAKGGEKELASGSSGGSGASAKRKRAAAASSDEDEEDEDSSRSSSAAAQRQQRRRRLLHLARGCAAAIRDPGPSRAAAIRDPGPSRAAAAAAAAAALAATGARLCCCDPRPTHITAPHAAYSPKRINI